MNVQQRLAALAVIGCTAVLLAGGASALGATSKNCGNVQTGGHSYSISATAVTCSFAKKWVGVLAAKRLAIHASRTTLSGGPKGFGCVAGTKPAGSPMVVAGTVQIAGNCAKGIGLGNSPYFNWTVRNAFNG